MKAGPPTHRPGDGSPLAWLAAQTEYPKALVWDRERDEWLAGAGAAELYVPRGPVTTAAMEAELVRRVGLGRTDGPGWIGGARFAVERAPSGVWQDFGAGWWMRPRVWWTRQNGVESSGECAEQVPFEVAAGVELQGEPPGAYLGRVQAALEELAGGQLAKIVLARCVHRPGAVDPAATLHRMVATETAGKVYWLALDPHEGFLGLTPETLYRRRGRQVETEALAGTSGLGEAAGDALLVDAKSLREHGYVRDAIVAALQPLSTELTAAATPSLHPMARLQHLRTPISAQLRGARPLLSHLHPTPAVCGTPYAAAEAAIARLESGDRGLYAGAVGWFGRDGESLHVALRGARYSRRGCLAHLGAGIVQGSRPEAELRELDLKAEALFAAFTPAQKGATR